jgi:hypothetical protein
MIAPWKDGDPSTPENLPGRLMWFHRTGKRQPSVLMVAPLVEAAKAINDLRAENAALKAEVDRLVKWQP